MVSVLTNESALIAIQNLRSTETRLADVQQTIASGLAVRESSDNPAFFLVSEQIKADENILRTIADNLTLADQAVATAESGIEGIFAALENITDSLITADTGVALEELDFAIQNEVSFIRETLEATTFNGVNLLTGKESFSITSGLTRSGSELSFDKLTISALNLDSLDLDAEGVSALTPEDAANRILRAYNPGLDEAFDVNGDGRLEVEDGSPDDVGSPSDGLFTFQPTSVDDLEELLAAAPYLIPAPSPQGPSLSLDPGAVTPGLVGLAPVAFTYSFISPDFSNVPVAVNGSLVTYEGGENELQFFEEVGFDIVGNTTTTFTIDATQNVSAFPATPSGPLPPQREAITAVFDDDRLRDLAEGSSFSGLLELLTVTDRGIGIESQLIIVDELKEKLNLASAQLGVLGQTISERKEFLNSLSSSLEIGVAALIEADLDEESTRLEATQVQRSLSVQALGIANAQPQAILALYN